MTALLGLLLRYAAIAMTPAALQSCGSANVRYKSLHMWLLQERHWQGCLRLKILAFGSL